MLGIPCLHRTIRTQPRYSLHAMLNILEKWAFDPRRVRQRTFSLDLRTTACWTLKKNGNLRTTACWTLVKKNVNMKVKLYFGIPENNEGI